MCLSLFISIGSGLNRISFLKTKEIETEFRTQRLVGHKILVLYGKEMIWTEYLDSLYFYAEQSSIDDSTALELAVM